MSIKIPRIHGASKEKTTAQAPGRAHTRIRAKWSVRRFRAGSLTGPASVEFTFPTEGGGLSKIVIPYSGLRLRHMNALLDTFSNHLPEFPAKAGLTDKSRFLFIQEIVSSYPGPLELLPDRTGFIDIGAFATYSEIVFADGRRQPIPELDSQQRQPFTDVRGTPEEAKEVLKLARRSSYLAFGIGVALASPLPSYLKLRRNGANEESDHLTETAMFNWSGPSSGGKTSVNLAATSLAGSPERAGTLAFTSRGLAEIASDSNDLVLVLDDTEKAEDEPGTVVKALKSIVHAVPGGRSKRISRGVDQNRFPPLRWSNFGLCSSPKPIFELAAENKWEMTMGDKVRLFDMRVPPPEKGGIFDLIDGTPTERAKRSVKLIAKLERGYQNHYGHVFPDWVLYLMAKDRSKKTLKLVDRFIEYVGAEKNGWETRFARKFGYVYAAMVMGIDARLLPWPRQLPLRVAARCFRKARAAAKTASERFTEAVAKLHRLIHKPGRMVNVPLDHRINDVIKVRKRCIAIRYIRKGRTKFGVLDSALQKLTGTRKGKAMFTRDLAKAGLVRVGHGHAGTVQERFKIERHGKVVERPRLWSIEANKLSRFLRNSGVAA